MREKDQSSAEVARLGFPFPQKRSSGAEPTSRSMRGVVYSAARRSWRDHRESRRYSSADELKPCGAERFDGRSAPNCNHWD